MNQVGRYGVTGRAVTRGLLALHTWNPRSHAGNRYGSVDDRPYGGGPGMVLQAPPLRRSLAEVRKACGDGAPVVAFSPQGERFDHRWALRLAAGPGAVFVCGRYEGMDQRFVDTCVDCELSLGDFVLSGGELAAMAVIDAVARLLPGALGDEDSAAQDSFAAGLLDHPHYSRPENEQGGAVPSVLLSGDHQAIARWRLKQALGRTWLRRPDLLDAFELDPQQRALLAEFVAEQK
ncbi:MAG: tRNA (guanosine(37)-N1)-methyltransferase TrmD [Salinisphaera sp.]|nr:tRNA (guanosine(37)-N1)-methyltransferase TrmD [Salinisphaera sp.]